MARQIQLRRGTAIQHTTFTGANGEVTVDTTNKTLRVHDGTTPGGTPLARADSVTDMSGADYIVAWQTPTDQNNYTWYRKYKSGWVEQGGQKLAGIKTYEIPILMANTNYTVLLETKNNYGITLQYNIIDTKHIIATSQMITGDEYNSWEGKWYIVGLSA